MSTASGEATTEGSVPKRTGDDGRGITARPPSGRSGPVLCCGCS